jgi:CO dehydrogenase/acetyl-CoA synthase beta subunit
VRPADIYIKRVNEYIEKKKSDGRPVTELDAPTDVTGLTEGMPIKVGPGANPRILLEEDTFVELGSPSTASCAFVLFTDEIPFVRDGRITLIGEDIHNGMESKLPFAQVIMVASEDFLDSNYPLAERTQFVSDQIEGYMIRAVSQRLWSRVSKQAVEKGFSFEVLGRALMSIYRTRLSFVDALEVLFVASSKDDVLELSGIAKEVKKITREIKEIKKKEYINPDLCNECDYEKICEEIKEMVRLRGLPDSTICIR